MALVPITGFLRNAGGTPIPQARDPRVFLIPLEESIEAGLADASPVRATITNYATGAWTVRVQSLPGLRYKVVSDYLVDTAPTARTRRKRYEWPQTFLAGNGGPVEELVDLTSYGPIVAALGAPRPGTTGVVWINLLDQNADGALVLGPEGAA